MLKRLNQVIYSPLKSYVGRRCISETATISSSKEDSGKTFSTLDNAEIKKFKKLVNIWWDENGEMKALHSMNELRIPFIRDGLKNRGKLLCDYIDSGTPLKELNILDIGCGGGILSEPLARLGAKVTGIDACKELIETAKLHASSDPDIQDNLKYVHGTLEDLVSTYSEKFDAVVTSETVEHVASKETFLKSCVNVLKPDGSLFLTTVNRTNLSYVTGIVVAEYILNIVPKGTHDWNKFVEPHVIQRILENYDCQTRTIHGMLYNVILNRWNWIQCTQVNYALHAVKLKNTTN